MAGLSAGAKLRAALAAARGAGECLKVVGAPSAYTALMASRKGLGCVYLSGGGVALDGLGVPDLGVTTLQDVLEDARRITRVCPTPLLVDIDTGFGATSLNIARTVQDMEAAGVAGVHLEDQEAAKRCGHRPNKRVVSTAEMAARIRAAVGARRDPDFLVMARTDAVAAEGLDRGIERCRAYAAAGADAIFAEALTELADFRRFTAALGPGVPVLANITEFGRTPLFSCAELADAGVAMALYPLSAFRAMSKAAEGVYDAIAREGSQAGVVAAGRMHTRLETYEVIEYERWEREVDRWVVGEGWEEEEEAGEGGRTTKKAV